MTIQKHFLGLLFSVMTHPYTKVWIFVCIDISTFEQVFSNQVLKDVWLEYFVKRNYFSSVLTYIFAYIFHYTKVKLFFFPLSLLSQWQDLVKRKSSNLLLMQMGNISWHWPVMVMFTLGEMVMVDAWAMEIICTLTLYPKLVHQYNDNNEYNIMNTDIWIDSTLIF